MSLYDLKAAIAQLESLGCDDNTPVYFRYEGDIVTINRVDRKNADVPRVILS